MKNITWFKTEVAPHLKDFNIEYRFFKDGDLGDLNQVEFNSITKGGEIDFWSSGWLSVHLVDYAKGEELLNILMNPKDQNQKETILRKLQDLLSK